MIARIALSLPLLGILPMSCGAPTESPETIYIAEYTGAFDADSGDVVNVIMTDGSDSAIIRCDDMGGRFHFDSHNVPVCNGIDF